MYANPNVLQFAYNMYQSMQMPVNGSFHISPILSTVPQEQNQGIMQSQDKVIIFIYFWIFFKLKTEIKYNLQNTKIDKNRSRFPGGVKMSLPSLPKSTKKCTWGFGAKNHQVWLKFCRRDWLASNSQ